MQQIEPTEHLNEPITNPPVNPAFEDSSTGSFIPAKSEDELTPGNALSNLKLFFRVGQNGSENELDRKRSLLLLMMGAVLIFIITTFPLTILLGLSKSGDVQSTVVGSLALLVAFGLVLLNRIKTASYAFLAGVMLALLLRSLDNSGGNLATISFNYFAIAACIALAGLIIDQMAPFIIAVSGILGFGLALLVYASNNSIDTGLIVQTFLYGAGLHLIMALMSWGNARAIHRVLGRLNLQNHELLEANARLKQTAQRDVTLGNLISDLSSDLSQISYDQSNRSQGQAQSVAIVTSTLEELGATARLIAEVAESVVIATEQALETAESGGQAVGLSIDSISTLTVQVEGISEIASELGKQSKQISEIVETISDLADETNLLALNATIEAAGAGEYGRRFAVVASEVQMLANRSRNASRDVQAILGKIRRLIDSTLLATEGGLNEARRMSEVASQAGESIEQIIETVESTTYLARQINLTTQQQRSATEQAVEMVRRVAGDSREAATRASQLLAVSDRLSQTATHLHRD